jgi:hypothetical protein
MVLLVITDLFGLGSKPQAVQLPADSFMPAKMPMTLVFPRPDSEAALYARHRNAYADGSVRYEVPIVIQGGAYPFTFELLSGPPGMVVGNNFEERSYGVVTWTPSVEGGPYPVTVKVTDQEQNVIQASWTIAAKNSAFIFVDPNVISSGAGTKGNPYKFFNDVHKSNPNDSTNVQKIVYLRAGTHTLTGSDASGNYHLTKLITPVSWVGYPDETAVVDASKAKFIVDNADDVFVSGFRMTSARNDVPNAHFWFFNQNAPQSRVTFYKMQFDNIDRGASGTDNPAAICFFNPGSMRKYFALIDSTIENYASPILDAYAVSFGVVERITLGSGKLAQVNQGILLKSDLSNFSLRRVTSLVQDFSYGAVDLLMQSQIFPYDNVEVTYSVLKSATRSLVYNWTEAKGFNKNPRIYLYRNTLIGQPKGLDAFLFTVYVEKNIVADSNGLQTSGAFRAISNIDNRLYPTSSLLIDSLGRLQGDAAQLRGTYGHEVLMLKAAAAPSPPTIVVQQ